MLNTARTRNWLLAGLLCLLHINAQAELAVIVSAKRPVIKMTLEEVAKVYLAKATTFPDGQRALPIDQSRGLPIRDYFIEKVLDKSDSQLRAYWSRVVFTGIGKPPSEHGNDTDIRRLVADNPNLIGYIDKSKLDSSVVAVLLVE